MNADTDVTVVGAGVMGAALARAFMAGGHSVTVWNRTRSRTDPLRDAGAVIADGPAQAIRASAATVVCLSNQAAVAEVLSTEGVLPALRGRTLIQLTTGTPGDGRRSLAEATERGIDYLPGAIMAYPRKMGTEAAVILLAGSRELFTSVEPLVASLGTIHYVGEDGGLPSVIDAGLIASFYGTLSGFLHGVRLARTAGVELGEYLALATSFFTGFISDAVEETGQRILAGDFGDAQSSMHTHLGGIELLVVGASAEAGIDHAVMSAIRDMFAGAIAAGRGDEDLAVLADL